MTSGIEGRDFPDGSFVPQTVVLDEKLIRAEIGGSACGHSVEHQRGLSGCTKRLPGARGRTCGASYSTIEDEWERDKAERDQALALVRSEFKLPWNWDGVILVGERQVYPGASSSVTPKVLT